MNSRIAVLTNIPSYHQVDLFDALCESGKLDASVVYCRPITPGRKWTRMPSPDHPHEILQVFWNDKPYWFSPTVLEALDRARPDLLVVCQYSGIAYQAAMLWATARRVPWVFWSESPGVKHFEVSSGVPERLKPLARGAAFLPARLWAREVWGIGRRAQEQYAALIGRPCENLPYYSRLEKFGRGDEPYAPGGVVRLLFAGRYSFRKGFDLLLEALALVARRSPDARWTLTLAGAGDLAPMLGEPRFAAVRERTTDLGFLELDAVPALMKRHDVFLTPSRYDGWGMVVPEALAAGMPVVASDEMGSALDIGERPPLLLFPAGSAEALAERIGRLLARPDRIAALGAEAAALSTRYGAEAGAARFEELATAALCRARAGARAAR